MYIGDCGVVCYLSGGVLYLFFIMIVSVCNIVVVDGEICLEDGLCSVILYGEVICVFWFLYGVML